jgi:hypothetical protein
MRIAASFCFVLCASPAFADGAVAVGLMGDTQWRATVEVNEPTRAKASLKAIRSCTTRTESSTTCYLYLRFRNQCAAVATAPANYGIGIGQSEADAVADALETCNRITPPCKLEAAACDGNYGPTLLETVEYYRVGITQFFIPALVYRVRNNMFLVIPTVVFFLGLIACIWYIRRLRKRLATLLPQDAPVSPKPPPPPREFEI